MDFSKLAEHVLTRRFPWGDDGFDVTWDANKFTGDLDRRLAKIYKERAAQMEQDHKEIPRRKSESFSQTADRVAKELEQAANISDLEKLVWADCLATDCYAILKGWDITREGQAVEPTYDELMKLPANLLKSLFVFCRDESLPKSQGTEATIASPMTQETIDDGSSSVPTDANPIM